MTFDLPIAERRLRNTARSIHQSMWLLFPIAAGLMVVVRRGAPARNGSIWILGGAVLAFMLSFALRDVVRKIGRRNTEDKIVKDVKTFLERQPAPPVVQPVPAKAAVSRTASPVGGVPSKSAGFVPLKGAAAYRTPAGDPVVFEAFPSHESIAIRMDFHAVLLPVLHNITPERRRTALSGDVSKKCIASSWRARMRRPGRESGCRKSMRTPAPRGVSRLRAAGPMDEAA